MPCQRFARPSRPAVDDRSWAAGRAVAATAGAARRRAWRLAGIAITAACAWLPAAAADDDRVQVQVSDPRAFGHVVGDVVTRTIVLDVPRRLALKTDSLPVPGRVNPAIELRDVQADSRTTFAGTRHTLRLQYQVFLAPREPKVLDLPHFTLKFDGSPRPEELRIDDAALGVVPMLGTEPSPRTGFGLVRPDAPPPRVSTRPERSRLAAYAVVALWPLGYLATVYIGWPWWRRRQRPFAQAERALQALPLEAPAAQWLQAWRALHAALDSSAGRVVSADAVDRFVAERPRFASLRADLAGFFERSQQLFFGGGEPTPADRQWLRAFCRRCFEVERGAA